MKKNSIIISIILVTFIAAVAAGFFYVNSLKKMPSSDGSGTPYVLNQKDIVAIAKPAVVHIVVHVSGKATLPNFKIDYAKMDIIPDQTGPQEEIPFDEYITGSGFFVNPNGYIMTNSHVVSYQIVKEEIARPYAAKILMQDIMQKMKSGNSADINPNATSGQGEELAEKMLDYLLSQGKFDIKKKIVVLDSSSTKEKIEDLFAEGIRASVVSVNDTFLDNDRDVALLKIDGSNFPSLKIGNPSVISVGSPVTVLGFPASADFNDKNSFESSLTTGTISAFKDSQNKDFKIFQTDAKISQGSSGGPMLDDKGEVVGVVTYQASDLQRNAGDNFAFALPADKAASWASAYTVGTKFESDLFDDSAYINHFKKGLQLLQNKRGKRALEEFNLVAAGDSKFPLGQYMDPYIQEAESLISSGQSIDSAWGEKGSLFSSNTFILAGLAGVVLVIMVIFIFLLMKRLKNDEAKLKYFSQNQEHTPENSVVAKENSEERTLSIPENKIVNFLENDQKDSPGKDA